MNIRSKLIKPRYNDDELIKAVDTVIDELITQTEIQQLDLVERSLYNEVLETNNDLSSTIANLERLNSQFQSDITTLESQVTQIEIDLEQAKISESVALNQLDSLRNQFQQLNIDFREALQKSIREGIEKVSLQAQNDGLRAEVNALNSDLNVQTQLAGQLRDQLEGRQSEIDQGADLLGDITILNLQQNDNEDTDVRFVTTANRAKNRSGDWIAGRSFRVRNSGKSTVTVRVTHSNIWMTPVQSTFTLHKEESKDITFTLNWTNIQFRSPTSSSGIFIKSKNYDGTLSFQVQESGQSTSFSTRLRKRKK